MLDFTSALYLGLRHGSSALGRWDALSLSRPAVLASPPGAEALAEQIAHLQGLEAAVVLPSTLHLFRDLFALLGGSDARVLVDECAYPIARWGAAQVPGGITEFGHHDSYALAEAARECARRGARPLVLCDGYCPGCGRVAPLRQYADIAGRYEGHLVLDDTQALGILGMASADAAVYGTGGGGALRWCALRAPHIVVGASLAKAFGAPLAVLSGNAAFIARFRNHSETLVHSSPPTVPVIRAARHALAVNARCGDALRRRLSGLVERLRSGALRVGLRPVGRLAFPMQSFHAVGRNGAVALHERLLRHGVRTVVTRACDQLATRLTFLVTARHRLSEVDAAGRLLTQMARAVPAHARA